MKRIFILRSDNSRNGVKRGLYSALQELPVTENFEISIQVHKENKTNEQRSFWHILCRAFGDETGYTLEEIKEMVKAKQLGTKNVMGIEVTRSSEKIKRPEYTELIEATYRLAAEAGVILPPATIRGR